MPRRFLLRCFNYNPEKSCTMSSNTAYTSVGPIFENEKPTTNHSKIFSYPLIKSKENKDCNIEEMCNVETMLGKYPWYHGKIDRTSAEQLVLGRSQSCEGTFLVRQSQTRSGQHVLTFNLGGKATHLQFFFNRSGQCRLKHLSFDSVFDMLEHFQVFDLPVESTRKSEATLTNYVNILDNNCKFITQKRKRTKRTIAASS